MRNQISDINTTIVKLSSPIIKLDPPQFIYINNIINIG